MEAGKPIEALKDDQFERGAFAEHLSSSLILHKNVPSIVMKHKARHSRKTTEP